jgi:hypothetical protein
MREFVYDSGALVAIDDRASSAAFDRHMKRLARDNKVFVPAVVAAQVVRDPASQARLMLALHGCELVPFDDRHHLPVGRLLARSGTSDVVAAFVALTAALAGAAIFTSAPDEIRLLLAALGSQVPVLPV